MTHTHQLTRIALIICCIGFTFTSCSNEELITNETSSVELEASSEKRNSNPLKGKETSKSWADSFSFKGKCYCKSTYDHGIGDVTYEGKKVRSICEKMKKAMKKALKSKGKKVYYNTVQCGHAPAHKEKTIKDKKGKKQADEVHCPGIVGKGKKCNSKKGPKWDEKYLK